MSEIRERLEEIRRLSRRSLSLFPAVDLMDEIHEDATKALALLGESEPVAWKVEVTREGGIGAGVYWHESEPDDVKILEGYTRTVTPLFTSPTPTQATEDVTQLRAERDANEIAAEGFARESTRLRARVEELEELRDWVLLYDDAIREGEDADAVFHDMVKSARDLTGQEEDANG